MLSPSSSASSILPLLET
jgi:hypothetical protein